MNDLSKRVIHLAEWLFFGSWEIKGLYPRFSIRIKRWIVLPTPPFHIIVGFNSNKVKS
ncbi:hypothetical protein BD770DRAFT_376232 [Pilaira anomala]|nr:hypothetical protein BD770DRAFT_376232 [Pilaira anomala]